MAEVAASRSLSVIMTMWSRVYYLSLCVLRVQNVKSKQNPCFLRVEQRPVAVQESGGVQPLQRSSEHMNVMWLSMVNTDMVAMATHCLTMDGI